MQHLLVSSVLASCNYHCFLQNIASWSLNSVKHHLSCWLFVLLEILGLSNKPPQEEWKLNWETKSPYEEPRYAAKHVITKAILIHKTGKTTLLCSKVKLSKSGGILMHSELLGCTSEPGEQTGHDTTQEQLLLPRDVSQMSSSLGRALSTGLRFFLS